MPPPAYRTRDPLSRTLEQIIAERHRHAARDEGDDPVKESFKEWCEENNIDMDEDAIERLRSSLQVRPEDVDVNYARTMSELLKEQGLHISVATIQRIRALQGSTAIRR